MFTTEQLESLLKSKYVDPDSLPDKQHSTMLDALLSACGNTRTFLILCLGGSHWEPAFTFQDLVTTVGEFRPFRVQELVLGDTGGFESWQYCEVEMLSENEIQFTAYASSRRILRMRSDNTIVDGNPPA